MPFKPGQSGNPGGAYPVDIRNLNKISRNHVEGLLSHYLMMPISELREQGQREDIPAVEALVCQIAIKAIVNGDTLRADFLLNRLIGRVKEYEPPKQVENIDVLQAIPREELIKLVRMNRKRLSTPDE